MNQKDQNRLTMWKAVRRYLDQNQTTWSGNQPFTAAAATLDEAIADADAAQRSQLVRTTGMTLDKEALEEAAVEQVVALARSVKAYAMDEADNTLYQSVNYGKCDLTQFSQNQQVQLLRSIVETADRLVTALNDYGVQPAAIAAASAAVDAFEASLLVARVATTDRSVVTGSIPAIMKRGRMALAKMDNLAHIFSDPDFAAGFAAVRRQVAAGIRHENVGGGAKAGQ